MSSRKISLATAAVLFACAIPAQADIMDLGFFGIFTEDSNPADIAIGEAQLFMDVLDQGANEVLFVIKNVGVEMLTVNGVYFDDAGDDILDSFKGLVENPPDVDFMVGGNPMEFPGANDVIPPFMTDFHFTAEIPQPQTGIDPGETLGIRFNYFGLFGDLEAAILVTRQLRVGLSAIGFASEGSEGFVNVPAPGALALLAVAGLLGTVRRRRTA
ncbi:MAG: MYXO-CTERM sorting domain-containing protein [Planctomycetota bacterium]|jgi:hypothetical protein